MENERIRCVWKEGEKHGGGGKEEEEETFVSSSKYIV